MKKKNNLENLNKRGIIYEDESTEESEEENLKVPNSDCPCVCHGMYQSEPEILEHQKSTKVPTIFFCTRTHKQITNVIKEFKKTPYASDVRFNDLYFNLNYFLNFCKRMTILASRAHSCIHPQISKMSNKDEMCKKINKNKSLTNNLDVIFIKLKIII